MTLQVSVGRRRLPGYRLFLAVDTDTGQGITEVLTRGDTHDNRLLAVLARRPTPPKPYPGPVASFASSPQTELSKLR